MIKYCLIVSFQRQHYNKEPCMEEVCAFWDEERKQCCIKTIVLAAAAKSSGDSGQTYVISPSSYCQTNAVSNKIINDSYQLTRDIPIAPVLRERSN